MESLEAAAIAIEEFAARTALAFQILRIGQGASRRGIFPRPAGILTLRKAIGAAGHIGRGKSAISANRPVIGAKSSVLKDAKRRKAGDQ